MMIDRTHALPVTQQARELGISRRPNTSKPEPGHEIYPYLLRKLAVTQPNQVWATCLTYIPMVRIHG